MACSLSYEQLWRRCAKWMPRFYMREEGEAWQQIKGKACKGVSKREGRVDQSAFLIIPTLVIVGSGGAGRHTTACIFCVP